jgi:hypothetical protein
MDETKPVDVPAQVDGAEGKPVAAVRDEVDVPETSKSEPAAVVTGSAPASGLLQTLTDRALHFLSHASNETLGACLVGLGATTYFVLGRVGLVIIGVAGGVVLHATWDGIRGDDRDDATKKADQQGRKEAGVEVAKRLLEWKAKQAAAEAKAEDGRVYASQNLDFSSFGPETATALETFTNTVIKDYVHYWYDPTIPGEQTFPASCKRTLTAFLLSVTGHLRRKRPADVFLDFVTNASSIIIVFLNELSVALNASPNAPVEDAISTYLQLKPDSSLSYMLNEDSQKAKLADASEDILQAYLDPKAYNCEPVHVFLKEVLAQLVLGYTVTYCSAPTFLNEWIVYGLEESATTKEVMDMIDTSVEGRQDKEVPPTEPAKKVNEAAEEYQEVKKEKQAAKNERPERPVLEEKRRTSRAEDAMDEAMQEAKRLTQLMIEEDEKRAREEQGKLAAASSSEDVSDATTQGAHTPTSSQSDKERQSEEAVAWSTQPSTPAETPATQDERPSTPTSNQQFTSFDQILPSQQPTALSPERARREQLTLHNASISIFDDSQPGERTSIKAKPTSDYLVQIEPSSQSYSGWMIARKYADFETLHEVLRRISVITGVPQFTQAHAELPKWKTHTKSSLRSELERYLTDAVRFQSLAESEGMKRFLEKDQGLRKSPGGNKGFGWPTPDAFGKLGGDMMNVLTKAPKQVGAGGKAVFGGVAGLVGVGGKKPGNQSQSSLSRTASNSTVDSALTQQSRSNDSQMLTSNGHFGLNGAARQSQESVRSVPPTQERKSSVQMTGSTELRPRPGSISSPMRPSSDLTSSTPSVAEASPTSSQKALPPRPEADAAPSSPPAPVTIPSLDGGLEAAVSLPPPPSEIPDDFEAPQSPKKSTDTYRSSNLDQVITSSSEPPPTPPRPSRPQIQASKPDTKTPAKEPLTERETSVAIELLFALIQELYTLSSAWQIRRTLLSAAKNFLLRPGNPHLLTIRSLIQESLLDSNLSDHGIAAHIYKLRENTLPTTEELERWKVEYPEKTEAEKEALREKAKALLVTKGMPQALTSVMGAAASGQALGRVFECLQVERVARGLVFGLLLQGLRIVTH